MQKKRYWADSSVRARQWRANKGKAVLTYLHPSMVKALQEEAKRKNDESTSVDLTILKISDRYLLFTLSASNVYLVSHSKR